MNNKIQIHSIKILLLGKTKSGKTLWHIDYYMINLLKLNYLLMVQVIVQNYIIFLINKLKLKFGIQKEYGKYRF